MNFKAIFRRAVALWRGLVLWQKYAVVVAFSVLLIGGIYLKNTGGSAVAETPVLRAVQVASVSDLQNDSTPLPLIGEVKSVNEAAISTQSAGPIRHLYKKLGDYVPAGGIIAEIDNASERAALLQAQGALEAAQASVNKNDTLFAESKTSVVDKIQAVYSSNDDLVRSKLDVMFNNPTGANPQFVVSVSNQALLYNVQSERINLGAVLKKQSARMTALNESSDLKAEIQVALEETRELKTYIDNLSMLLNAAISTQAYPQTVIDGYIAVASAARATVSASLATLSAASQTLTSAQTQAEKPDEVSASGAAIKQAQAGVAAAEANLENTIVRSPISGTINSLPINLGDFVTTFQQVAVVSNNGALEIVAHITPEDRASISNGAKVTVENKYEGFVSSIAPAIDPATKKIEVKVGFTLPKGGTLTNGESVHLDISRAPKKAAVVTDTVLLPVSAVKIGTQSSLIFTIGEDKKLVAHEIKIGDLVGDKIQVLEGATADMRIVTDARGLKAGQQVELQ